MQIALTVVTQRLAVPEKQRNAEKQYFTPFYQYFWAEIEYFWAFFEYFWAFFEYFWAFLLKKRKGLKILFFYKLLISALSSFSEMIISEYGIGHSHSFENDLGEQVKSVSGENLPEQI